MRRRPPSRWGRWTPCVGTDGWNFTLVVRTDSNGGENRLKCVFLPQLRPTECRTSPTALTTRELPENVVAKTGFKTVELDWNPCGHPPL
eukprot:911529-Prorocentrum_minimum.AAC.1